jgi:hypothetical protein
LSAAKAWRKRGGLKREWCGHAFAALKRGYVGLFPAWIFA